MEFGSAMKRLARALLLCCAGILVCTNEAVADHEVVLVTAASSPLHNIDSLALRKIYLGYTVILDGKSVTGLRNTSDAALNKIFYQNVVSMSEKSYLHRILFHTIQRGTPRPAEYDNLDDLIRALTSNPYSISYMWKESAEKSPGIKILRVLWEHY
jgi:hypothetical protein